MTDVDYKNWTLTKKSVLIKLKPKQEIQKTNIYFKEEIDSSQIQFFEVLKVSPSVTLVKVGDVVGISWLNCTQQFEAYLDGVKYKMGMSDEDQIEFILE
jgi:hypothetical protein